MKIVFLNTWGGRQRDEIIQFIKKELDSTDIFCFQEVYKGMWPICNELLQNYQNISFQKINDNGHVFSLAIYFKDSIKLVSSGEILADQGKAGLALYAHLKSPDDHDIHVGNVHGTASPEDKLDDPDRIVQSKKLIDFFKNKDGLKIIGGDFNLLPETRSIKMFEENNYTDLIKNHKVETTRNQLAWQKYPGNKQFYADYVFTSPNVKVENFSVPEIEVSDHLPLILSFN